MPYMLNPANYTQTMRPNLYNMAYRRIGAYKGMGRLHPSNYLEIGTRPNRIGATAGQYNTLSGQLSLNPPSLRGLGAAIPVWDWRRHTWRRGLGNGYTVVGPPADPVQAALMQMQQNPNPANPPADYGTGANILTPTGQIAPGAFPVAVPSDNTWMYVAGGVLLLLMLGGRR